MKTNKLKLKIFFIDKDRMITSLALVMTEETDPMDKFSNIYLKDSSLVEPEDTLKEINLLTSKIFLAYHDIVGDWVEYIQNNKYVIKLVLNTVSEEDYTLIKVEDGDYIVEYPKEVEFDTTLEPYGYNYVDVLNIIYDYTSKLDKKIEHKGHKIELETNYEHEYLIDNLVITLEPLNTK